MAYIKKPLVDNETVIDKELLDHIQDGIVELWKQIEGAGNLIDENTPTSAPSSWAQSSEGWVATNSNYENLRFDAALEAKKQVAFSFVAQIQSGGFNATIRDGSNTTLVSSVVNNGSNTLRYEVEQAGTYSFRIAGNSASNKATISQIKVAYEETSEGDNDENGLPAEYVEEAVRVAHECLDLDADLRILLFSDNHDYTPNKYKKYTAIMEQGVFDYSVGLGDYVDYSHIEKPKARVKLLESMNYAGRKPNQIYALGNHDVGICGVNAGTDSLDVVMTPKESFDVHCRHLKNNPNVHFNPADPFGCYYYVDDEVAKIRLIILNTCDIFNHTRTEPTEDMTFEEYQATAPYIRYQQQLRISQEQLDWIAHKALNFIDKDIPGDWSVMLFGHWSNPYGSSSKNILHSILVAAKNGTSLTKSVDVSTRLTMTEQGVYSKTVDSTITDTYSVEVDYTEQGAIEIIGFMFGHDHVDTTSLTDGIRYVEVRCDNSGVDDFYITPWTEDIGNETYYFYSASGKLHTFTRSSSTPITDIGYIGYNNYWFRAGGTWPITVFDKNGLRKTSISNVNTVTEVPANGIEITGFVRERGDTLVGEESCEILCINKKDRTLTFIPYGTATKRILTY